MDWDPLPGPPQQTVGEVTSMTMQAGNASSRTLQANAAAYQRLRRDCAARPAEWA